MRQLIKSLPAAVCFISLFGIAFQLWAGQNYDMFRDEFYYIECAKHLAFGYVDHPPFSILKLSAWIGMFGDSLFSIRIIPSVLFGLLIIMVSILTIQMNGSSFASIISALIVLSSPQILGITGFYSMNSFELFFWALLFLILVIILKGADKRLWLLFGIILGFGLMNKFSIGILAVALNLSMYFTPLRKDLTNKYFLAGNLIAFLIFTPFLVWNYLNGFPTIEFMSNAAEFKNVDINAADFFLAQIMNMGPVNSILWLAGLLALFFSRSFRDYRILGFIYVVSFLILAGQNSKPYYLSGAYPPLFAAGAIALTSWGKGWVNATIRYSVLALLVLTFIFISPLAVPVLSPDSFTIYSDKLGIKTEESEKHEKGLLPQHFADRFGWEELTDKVYQAFNSLPEIERNSTLIYTQNYGEAGAINYYGQSKGLPNAISGHNNFWIWGVGERDVSTLIIVGGDKGDYETVFEEVKEFTRTDNRYCMPYENNMPIFIARKPKQNLRSIWNDAKHFQ
jgi:4-amino-4-deoxy-L-arabinose transferase-like glycosyltransferase